MSKAAESARYEDLDANVKLFSVRTDAIKHFAEYGKGNMIMLDGSKDRMDRTLKQMLMLGKSQKKNSR